MNEPKNYSQVTKLNNEVIRTIIERSTKFVFKKLFSTSLHMYDFLPSIEVFCRRVLNIACIQVDGNDVPLFFPVEDKGCTRVLSHLLYVRFRFVESSIYVEEERMLEPSKVQQSIPIVRSVEDEGHRWYLGLGNYRAYGLFLSILATSTEILSRQFDNSIVDMPYFIHGVSPSPTHEVLPVLSNPSLLQAVKVERLHLVIELSSELEGESSDLTLHK